MNEEQMLIVANRWIFRRGQDVKCFYYLRQGSIKLSLSMTSMIINGPCYFGDFQQKNDLSYRVSQARSLTHCQIKIIKSNKIQKQIRYDIDLIKAFQQKSIINRQAIYWGSKFYYISYTKRGQKIGGQGGNGFVLQGSYIIDKNVSLVPLKYNKLQLLKKFQISLLGPHQLFTEEVTCESVTGKIAFCNQVNFVQLVNKFQQFRVLEQLGIDKLNLHKNMAKSIAKNCKKRRNLFEQLVPVTLQSLVKKQQKIQKQKQYTSQKIQDLYSLKQNMSHFFHGQLRYGASLKSNKLNSLSLSKINSDKMKKKNKKIGSNFIQIPQQFGRQKFKLKMLFKQKVPYSLRSMRTKTQAVSPTTPKLLFL